MSETRYTKTLTLTRTIIINHFEEKGNTYEKFAKNSAKVGETMNSKQDELRRVLRKQRFWHTSWLARELYPDMCKTYQGFKRAMAYACKRLKTFAEMHGVLKCALGIWTVFEDEYKVWQLRLAPAVRRHKKMGEFFDLPSPLRGVQKLIRTFSALQRGIPYHVLGLATNVFPKELLPPHWEDTSPKIDKYPKRWLTIIEELLRE